MAERLSRFVLYSYGIADLFFALMLNMEAYFFTAFLTDYAQFSLAGTGQILGFTSLIDIGCALAGGVLLQKATLKYGGKYRSWFLVGPPLIAPLFILQFTKIGSNTTAASLVMLGFIASHLLLNIVVAASGAMVGRLSQLPDERTILSASRAQGMAAAGLIFSITSMPMILFFGAHTDKVAGFTLAVSVYAFLMIGGYLLIYRMTAGRDPYDETPMNAAAKKSGQSVKEIISLVFKNPPLLYLTLAQVFSSTGYFLITAIAIYHFTYVIGKPAFLSVFMLATSIARLVGTFSAPWIGVRLGKRISCWFFLALTAIGFASARLLHQAPGEFTLVFCIFLAFASVVTGLNTALFSDTVVYGEWKTGKNIRAFTMALMNLPIKIGILIRSAVVTAGLMAIGFAANTPPSQRVIEGISSIMTLAPAAAYGIAAVIFFFGYKINDSDVLKMQEEIAARKTGIPAEA